MVAEAELTFVGINSENVDPLPSSLANASPPPRSSERFFVIANPRPVPPYLRDVLICA